MVQKSKKLYVVSLGCSKAQVDAEAAIGALLAQGYTLVDAAEKADTVVVNTCGFIEPAVKESLDAIVDVAALKSEGAIKELIVSGCLVDRYGGELAGDLPEVDRFIGSGAFKQWSQKAVKGQKILASPGPALPSASDQRVLLNAAHFAYVKIAEGCDRACAFCTIPGIRGKQQSRGSTDILQELAQLAGQGVKEAVLISQDTVRWGLDLSDKQKLVELLAAIEDVETAPPWVRLHYLYPERFSDALIARLAQGKRILPYIDIPIQHAADNVLTLMRRAHRQADIRNLVERLRAANPAIAIRTTVIVGHPGETTADVDALCDLLQELRFDAVGIFTYWNEAGTAAYDLPDHVEDGEKRERAAAVEEVAREVSEDVASQKVGQRLRVLVDGVEPNMGEGWVGRHVGQAPDVDGVVQLPGVAGPAGSFIDVEIVASEGFDLVGKPLDAVAIPVLRRF